MVSLLMIMLLENVVYFDQHLGAAHSVKIFLFHNFHIKNVKKSKNEAKNVCFGFAPKCWSKVFSVNENEILKQRLGASPKNTFFVFFASFFILFYMFMQKTGNKHISTSI